MRNGNLRFEPAKKSKEDVRRIYARLSRIYDYLVFFEAKALNEALRLADIKNGESILEVAVGTGRIFERIVNLNKNGRNEGMDLSPEMLKKAARRLKKHPSNFNLKVADAYSLPYQDRIFDLIISNYMFDLMPENDFPLVLLEFKRVLKPGGRVIITSMTKGRIWYNRIWDWLVHKAPNILEGCRPISIEEDLRHVGFKNVYAQYISQFTFPSLVIRANKS